MPPRFGIVKATQQEWAYLEGDWEDFGEGCVREKRFDEVVPLLSPQLVVSGRQHAIPQERVVVPGQRKPTGKTMSPKEQGEGMVGTSRL